MWDQLGTSSWIERMSVGDQDQGELEDQQQQGPGQKEAVPEGLADIRCVAV